MEKSGKSTPKTNTQSSVGGKQQSTTSKFSAPAKNWLERPVLPVTDPMLRKVFWGLAALGLVVLIALSFGSGINADDKFQVDYSQKLVN